MRKCNHCGGPIPAERGNAAKYCSEKCARVAQLTPNTRVKIRERSKRKGKQDSRLLAAYGFKCAVCGWGLPIYAPGYKNIEHAGGCEMHHIVQVKDGGTDDPANLVLLCPNCHKAAHVGILTEDTLKSLTLSEDMIRERYEAALLAGYRPEFMKISYLRMLHENEQI